MQSDLKKGFCLCFVPPARPPLWTKRRRIRSFLLPTYYGRTMNGSQKLSAHSIPFCNDWNYRKEYTIWLKEDEHENASERSSNITRSSASSTSYTRQATPTTRSEQRDQTHGES